MDRHSLKTRLTKSLTSRIILSLMLVNLVLLPALFYWMFSIVKVTNNENFVNQVRIGTFLMSSTIGSILNTYNNENYNLIINQINEVIEDAMLSGEVVYFEIFANDETLLRYTSPETPNLEFKEDFKFSDNNDDVYFISNQLGNINQFHNVLIRLGYDEFFLKTTITKAHYNSLAVVIIYCITLILICYVLSKKITLPLNRLREIANNISSGLINERMDLVTNIEEVRQLSDDLELMRNELVKQANTLEYISKHDMLTDLPNRRMLNEQLSQELNKLHHNETYFSLLLIDLNGFKDINDTYGHHIGDLVLKETSNRLNEIILKPHTTARLGGDEFAIVIRHNSAELITRKDKAKSYCEKISCILKQEYVFEKNIIHLSASIGIAHYPEDSRKRDELMRFSDTAMYDCKKNKLDYVFYHSRLGLEAEEKLKIRNNLKLSLEHGEFDVYYQPKFNLTDDHLIGFEALSRWKPKGKDLVPPDQFIPIMEKTGLINDLMQFVLNNALEQLSEWHKLIPDITVAINLSAINLMNDNLSSIIFDGLHKYDIDPQFLEIELTESAFIEDPIRSISSLETLHNAGIRISIDDFGTGYSSLAYLRDLPISTLKIDKTFVKEMLNQQKDLSIVKATIDMAHNLELDVTAEGVEDEETKLKLIEMGCETAQGYYYSPAIDSTHCRSYIEEFVSLKQQLKLSN